MLIKNYKSKESILFVDRERLEAAYFNSYLAAAINNKYKKKIIILSDFTNRDNLKYLYKSFGFKYFINGANKLKYLRHQVFSFKAFFKTLKCFIEIKNKGFLWFINSFKVEKILIGDLIYDTHIRFNNEYLKPKTSIKFLKLLFVSIFRTFLIIKYIKEFNVKIIIVGTEHYSFNSGLAVRISTYFQGIKNYSYKILQRKENLEIVQINKNTKFIGQNSLKDEDILEKFNKLYISQNKINTFYQNRKKLKTRNFYTNRSFKIANSGDGKFFIEKIKGIAKGKKIILFASHRLADATHHLGIKYAFENYYNQFEETLRHVYLNDNENIWIFRPHPSSNKDGEREKLLLLFNKFKKKNIFFCPNKIPVDQLKELCDLVVTGRGTIALEFLCEGKPAILAGLPRYYHKDLGLKFFLKKEKYFCELNKIIKLKYPNKNSLIVARKILFFFENGFHVKNKINYLDYKKDQNALKIFEISLKKNNITSKDYEIISKIFNKNLDKSYFYSLIKKNL